MKPETFAPTIKRALATGLLLATTVTTLLAQPGKLAPDLAGLDPSETIDVIIQLEDSPSPRPGAPRPARPLALGGVNLASQRPVRELGLINGLSARLPAASLASLAADPRVKYISPDRPVTASTQNAIPAVNANVAQAAGFDGRGIGIAVIDSGVSEHADLKNDACTASRVVYRQNFVASDFSSELDVFSDPAFTIGNTPDLYGHGTHVAGILAGNGRCSAENNGKAIINGVDAPQTRLIGIAPRAHLIDLQALNSNGAGTDSSVIQAIDRAIALKTQYNIRVINLSLGRPIRESFTKDPLCLAVERAWRAGITVVVAAGNRGRLDTVTDKNGKSYRIDGYGTIGSPANHPLAITVGAMRDMGTPSRTDDLMASYSSKGPSGIDRIVKPDLVAPGNRLLSTSISVGWFAMRTPCTNFPTDPSSFDRCLGGHFLEANFPDNRTRIQTTGYQRWSVGSFIELSGTSMATPMVAGAAALLLQKTPTLTPDAVKARLMKTATKSFPTRSTFGNKYPRR